MTFASTITAAPSGMAWSGRGIGVRQSDQRVGEHLLEVGDGHIGEEGGQSLHRAKRLIGACRGEWRRIVSKWT